MTSSLNRIDNLITTLESDAKPRKKVLVSGCFDLFHSGHVKFFNEAAKFGDLYVRIGSDANIRRLKHHDPMFPESERLYLVQNIRSVYNAEISSGTGYLDFEPDINLIKPDIFYVNNDGDRQSKRDLCKKYGIQYIVHKRIPKLGLRSRSSTDIKASLALKESHKTLKRKQEFPNTINENKPSKIAKTIKTNDINNNHEFSNNTCTQENNIDNDDILTAFPWRLCLAGGWLDQPWVSSIYPGSVIVVNVTHHKLFKDRSGLATSSRKYGIKLWGKLHKSSQLNNTNSNKITRLLPKGTSNVSAARYLFGAENPPGSKYISGSQDALGLLLPGINRLDYNGKFWPHKIVTLNNEYNNYIFNDDDVKLTECQIWKNTNNKDNNDCSDIIIKWLESVLWLVPCRSRPKGYDSLKYKNLTKENVILLSKSCDLAWKSIIECNVKNLGISLTQTMYAWKKLLPETVPDDLDEWWKSYENESYIYGCLYSGAGGGFLMVIADPKIQKLVKETNSTKIDNKLIQNGFQVKINSTSWI